MTEIEPESIPPPKRRGPKYDWLTTKVGGCFRYLLGPSTETQRKNAYHAALMAGKRYGMRFTVRCLPNEIKIWRVE